VFVALLLFWAPIANGIVAGAFAGWTEEQPREAGGHALAASLPLFSLLWIIGLYGVTLPPFMHLGALIQAGLCVAPMIITALAVCAARTTHRSPAT